MKTPLSIALAALVALGNVARSEEPAALPLAQALTRADVKCAWSGNGRDQLSLAISNSSATPISITIPAGFIAASRTGGDKLIVLRTAPITIAARASADVALPVIALAAKNANIAQPYQATNDTEPRLTDLLKFLADKPDKPDAPRATAQLAALAILEDLTFPQWLQILSQPRPGEPPDPNHPTPAEITQAIDALGILRTIAPAKNFALATDGELKLRALRNPWCRVKAMQLYGITLPTSDGAVPPDLGQLLHTKVGDNCPICRQRAQMQAGPGDL